MGQEKKKIVFGLFAYRVDGGTDDSRRQRWRPLLELCAMSEFPVDTLYLFSQSGLGEHLRLLEQDLRLIAPQMNFYAMPSERDVTLFEEHYLGFYNYFKSFKFDFEHCDYYFYFPPGIFPQVSLAIMDIIRTLWLPLKIVQVYQYGAKDDSSKHFSIFTLDVQSLLQKNVTHEQSKLTDQAFLKSGIGTRNEAFNETIASLEHIICNTRAPILLSGASGVGKSQLVRRLYEVKKRHGQLAGPLVEVNCAILHGDTATATLFGHAKGAFTGAIIKREGLLLRAHNGMLFLDEIGELGLEEQVLLLKAVEEKRFLPLGSDTEVESRFQLICATNRDLAAEVRAGRFRQDLLARIDLWHFRLPALRERLEDIEPNVAYELERLSREMNLAVRFTAEAERRFLRFALAEDALWPGNFRELAATLERMATFSIKGSITSSIVEREITAVRARWRAASGQGESREDLKTLEEVLQPQLRAQLDLFEQFHLAGVIAVCRASATPAEAGRKLYAVSRLRKRRMDDGNRLHNYLKGYGLSWEDVRS